MQAESITRWAMLSVAAFLLFFLGASQRGLIGPDEPRYASVAREMAESGDWVTPRLGGEPWFEKPALLYWLGAAALRLGAPEDLATRLPVALLSVGFLAFFNIRLRRAFGTHEGDLATAALATMAGWAALSQAGIFDLPLAVSLGAALLSLLDWARDRNQKAGLPLFGFFLGLSVLAKGLVGPAIAALAVAPVCVSRGWLRTAADLFQWRALGPFLASAGPWYLLCWLRNGSEFFAEFVWRHHILRVFSSELQHVQPWWFYLPVLLAALLPWTPLVFTQPLAEIRRDPRVSMLASWAAGTVLIFSVATNKLPGYILPALPAVAALIGIRLARRPPAAWALGLTAALLCLAPLAAAILPAALADGVRSAWPPQSLSWPWAVAFAIAAGGVFWLARGGKSRATALTLAGSAMIALTLLKLQTFPALDIAAGTRSHWRDWASQAPDTCIGDVRRHVLYGLNYYSRGELPRCVDEPRPKRIESHPPRLVVPE